MSRWDWIAGSITIVIAVGVLGFMLYCLFFFNWSILL